ncbi:hypothetical protein [Agrobacterium tumefaciens]|uniref:Uncharacterized protein n=1 Tax=Agrobacterium tumefaciens TaxID=358 RepID=A0A176WY64_AGRTU|nr:hypothetical protein [Agrobacterium tumefaciens]OAE37621.1 hypothetical protein A7J57_08570 [Agrobacterium tumefaciens]
MREAIAKEYGFTLYRQYEEKQAAHYLGKDISTLKRWRRKGLIPFIRMGERGINYLGVHIADTLLRGVKD